MSRGVFDKRAKASNKISILIIAGLLIAFLVYCVKSGELANEIAKHGFVGIVAFAFLVFVAYSMLFRMGMGKGGKQKRR